MTEVHLRHWPGNPSRPALAIHCMMGTGRAFAPMAERLDGRVDLHSFDLPSHGRSAAWQPRAGDDYHSSITRIARGLLPEGPVDLIGHSIGGTVSLRIAVESPERVRSLTLIEPVIFAAAPTGHKLDAELTALADAGKLDQAARLFIDTWGGPGGFAAMTPEAQQSTIALMPVLIESNLALAADIHHILRPGGLEAISAPVMLIAGAESPSVIAEILQALAARLPDVGRATVPGAGHMLPITHPDQVTGLVAVNLDRA